MIKQEDFWDAIDSSVQEYLAMRYYNKTRCLLNASQISHIAKEELSFMIKINSSEKK